MAPRNKLALMGVAPFFLAGETPQQERRVGGREVEAQAGFIHHLYREGPLLGNPLHRPQVFLPGSIDFSIRLLFQNLAAISDRPLPSLLAFPAISRLGGITDFLFCI